jgi:hypothetical protein
MFTCSPDDFTQFGRLIEGIFKGMAQMCPTWQKEKALLPDG